MPSQLITAISCVARFSTVRTRVKVSKLLCGRLCGSLCARRGTPATECAVKAEALPCSVKRRPRPPALSSVVGSRVSLGSCNAGLNHSHTSPPKKLTSLSFWLPFYRWIRVQTGPRCIGNCTNRAEAQRRSPTAADTLQSAAAIIFGKCRPAVTARHRRDARRAVARRWSHTGRRSSSGSNAAN